MSANDHIVHVMIAGRVQGVGFRAFVEAEAATRGIRGWVRNRRDGSVEAVFASPPETVDGMLAVCRRGPRFARVDRVDVEHATEDALVTGRPDDGFSVRPTV
jgi:acylphosphatase